MERDASPKLETHSLDTKKVANKLFEKTINVLKNNEGIVKQINRPAFDGSFIGYTFKHEGCSYSISRIKEEKYLILMLYQRTELNAEGFTILINSENNKLGTFTQVKYSDKYRKEYMNSQLTVEKINSFLNRF